MKSKACRRLRDLVQAFVRGEVAHCGRRARTLVAGGVVKYQLYSTVIAAYERVDDEPPRIVFAWGGWRTATTQAHINRIVDALNEEFYRQVGVAPFRRISRKESFTIFLPKDITVAQHRDFVNSLYDMNHEAQNQSV